MSLTDQQRKFHEITLVATRQEIEELDRLIEEELAKVKKRLEELQNAKKASRQAYDACCMRLGVPNDLPAEEADSAKVLGACLKDVRALVEYDSRRRYPDVNVRSRNPTGKPPRTRLIIKAIDEYKT